MFQPYIVALPDVAAVGGSMVLSVRTLVSLFAMFFVNIYLDKVGVRLGTAIGCLCTAAGFAFYGLGTTLPVLCIGAVLAGLGFSFGGMVGMTLVINRWFARRVGTAIGIASLGNGVASVVVPLIAMQLIHNVSLAAAFFTNAAIALAVAAVVFAFLRDDPAKMGLKPFGADEVEDAGEPEQVQEEASDEKQPATAPLPRPVRFLLLAAMVCIGGICVGGMSYMSVNLTTLGYSEVFAGSMVSAAGAFLIISKLLTGEAVDRLGPRKGSTLMFGIELLGLLLMCLTALGSIPLAIAGSCLYGLGLAIGTVGTSVWSLGLSTPEHRAKTVKNFQVCYSLGCFLFNVFPGALSEVTGSYVALYVILFFCALFAAVVVIFAYRRYRPELGGEPPAAILAFRWKSRPRCGSMKTRGQHGRP